MMNRCIFMGRLAADPELRKTADGISCCTFRLAIDRDYKSATGERITDWLNFVSWRTTAEFITRNFKVGQPMLVECRALRRYYEKDGQKHWVIEFIVDTAYFAGGKNEKAPMGGMDEYGYLPDDTPMPWEGQ